MSLNQFVVGRSVKVVVTNPLTGASPLTLTNITSFESKSSVEKITSKPMNSPPIFASAPNGWTGNFEFDRVDNTIDNFFNAQEATYWANGQTFSGQIFEYITELNGTTSQYRYDGVMLTITDAGKKTSQAKIPMKVEFEASRRVTVT